MKNKLFTSLFTPLIAFLALMGSINNSYTQSCVRPNASLRLQSNDLCTDEAISALNQTDERNNPVFYIWDWGDGKRDTIQNKSTPQHIYQLTGCSQPDAGTTFNITLFVINKTPGCAIYGHSNSSPVIVFKKPIAAFQSPDSICLDKPTVDFQNLSCPTNTPNTTYLWNFGDPQSGVKDTSTVFNPTHTYTKSGTYFIKLKVSSPVCITDSIAIRKLIVRDTSKITVSHNSVACTSDILTFDNQSKEAISNIWTFLPSTGVVFLNGTNDSSVNPVVQFTQTGSFTASLRITNPCGDKKWTSQPFVIGAKPNIAVDSIPPVCPSASVQPRLGTLYRGALPTSFLWSFTEGAPIASTLESPTVSWARSGTYPIFIEATNSCGKSKDTGYVVVTFRAVADVAFTAPATVCAPFTVTPTNNSLYATGGYVWAVLNENGTPALGTAYRYVTSTPSSQNPAIEFLQAGRYKLNLTVKNTCGDASWASQVIDVKQKPTIGLDSITSICVNKTFTPVLKSSTNGNDANTIITWTFSDGQPTSFTGASPPAITYNTRGLFSVKTVISNICGKDSITRWIKVNEDAKADVSLVLPATNCLPYSITTINNSTGADSQKWDVINTATNQNAIENLDFKYVIGNNSVVSPSIEFLKTGRYQLKVTITNTCKSAAWDTTLVIRSKPSFGIDSISAICEGKTIAPTLKNVNTGNDNTIFNWTFNGGSPNSASNVNVNPGIILYANAGNYIVTVTGTNGCGTTTLTPSVNVKLEAKANISLVVPATNCLPYRITTVNNSTGVDSQKWDVINTATNQNAIENQDFKYVTGNNAATSPSIEFLKSGSFKLKIAISNTCKPATWDTTLIIRSKPSFTIDSISAICEGKMIMPILKNVDNGNDNTTFLWTFNGGLPTSASNVNAGTILYANAGNYIVTVTGTNGCGTTTLTPSVKVKLEAKANISLVVPATNCLPYSITTVNNSTGADSQKWDIINTVTGQNAIENQDFKYITGNNAATNPSIEFLKSGSFKLKIAIANTCKPATWDTTLVIRSKPSFTIDSISAICEGKTITPTLKNVDNGNDNTTFLWTFNGGSPNSASNVNAGTILYANAGNYIVTVTGTNGCGTTTLTPSVKVNPSAKANITLSGWRACDTFTIFLKNASIGAESYKWRILNSDNTLAKPSDYAFVNRTDSTSGEPYISFLQSGRYKIGLQIGNVCQGDSWVSDTFSLTLKPKPQLDTIAAICQGGSTTPIIKALAEGYLPTTVRWRFEQGTPNSSTSRTPVAVRYDSAGLFPIVLAADNQCGTDSVIRWIRVNEVAKVAIIEPIIPNNGCSPLVQISNNSTGVAGFKWFVLKENGAPAPDSTYFFANNTTDTARNPAIQFVFGGRYKINLQIANNLCGNAAWTSLPFEVKVKPKIQIEKDTAICVNNNIQPRIKSLYDGNTATTVNWIFEEGEPLAFEGNSPPSVLYKKDGVFTIFAIAKNSCGSDTARQKMTIRPQALPIVLIKDIPSNLCGPYTIKVDNNSKGAASFKWRVLNDNNTPVATDKYAWVAATDSNSQNPAIQLIKAGRYKLSLSIDNNCRSASWDTTLQVFTPPVITLDPITQTGICRPQTIGFKAQIRDDGGLPNMIKWLHTTDTLLNLPPRVFDTSGTFLIKVTATNICGKSADSANITIQPRPIVVIDTLLRDTICNSSPPILLKAKPLGGKWSGRGVNDNGFFDPSTLPNGNYPIIYSYGEGDCIERDTLSLVVFGTPTFAGNNIELCDTSAADFILRGATPVGGIWYGRGIVDSIAGQFSPMASGSGVHTLTYIFRDNATGCPNQANRTVTVFKRPEAVIDSIPPSCKDIPISFIGNRSLLSNTYQWDLGDNTTKNTANFSHTYLVAGEYTAQLIVTSPNNCHDTTQRVIRIAEPPTARLAPRDTVVCANTYVVFRIEGKGDNLKMSYPDGRYTNKIIADPYLFAHNSLPDTIQKMYLYAENTGCPAKRDTTTIKIRGKTQILIGASTSQICHNESIRFTNLSKGYVSRWFWDMGNGVTSTDSVPPITRYTTDSVAREYTIRLVGYGICGSDTGYYKIIVLPINTRAFFNTDKNRGCMPFSVRFTNLSSRFASIVYDFGDGTPRSSDSVATHIFTKAGTFKTTLYAFNSCGGFDSIQQTITVLQSPKIDSIQYQIADKCAETKVSFLSFTDRPVVGYFWRFDNGDSSKSEKPTIQFDRGGKHRAILTVISDQNSCLGIDSLEFILLSPLDLRIEKILPDSCGLRDGSISFYTEGGTTPYSYSLNNKENWVSASIFRNLQGQLPYIGYVRDARGCIDTISTYVTGNPPLNIRAGADITLKLGDSTTIRAQANFTPLSIQWRSDNPEWVREPNKAITTVFPFWTQTYSVIAKNNLGCIATDSMKIMVIPVKFIGLPDAYSPNNDGINDSFYPQCSKDVQKITVFRIYNRWGTLVHERYNFKPNDPIGEWIGGAGNLEHPAGVYSWYCEAVFIDGSKTLLPLKGSVTLVR